MNAVIIALEDYTMKNLDHVLGYQLMGQKRHVTEFFSNARTHIDRLLCIIRGIIYHHIDQINEGSEKKAEKVNELNGRRIRFDYWIMYREYETLIDYTYQMMNALVGEQVGKQAGKQGN